MKSTVRLALTIIVFGIIGFACMRIATAGPELPADPLQDPRAAFDDFKALYKTSWPLAVFAGLVIAARLASRLSSRFAFLAGKPAAVIAAVSALSASAFDVLALGGSWASVVAAVAFGALALWDAKGKSKLIDGGTVKGNGGGDVVLNQAGN